MTKIKDYSLYLVISEEYGLGKSAVEIAGLAISGGVDIIQMREKSKGRDELVKLAYDLSRLCKEKNVLFIVNDDPLIAKESGAGGVHLGQEDVKKRGIAETRRVIGNDKIIGISTHSLSEVKSANEEDVDYIAYGPIFPTKTKNYFIGAKDIKEALRISKKPMFFIGGINLLNLDDILNKGVKNIAMIRGIIQAEDIAGRARNFKDKLTAAGGREHRMIIKVNGKAEAVEENYNLAELVKSKKLLPENIVIEHNLCIVPKEEWPSAILRENDDVEIVAFMAGG